MNNKSIQLLTGMTCLALLVFSCHKILPAQPADDSILDGPIAGLSSMENARFLQGDIAFNDEVFTQQTGLGPLFVTNNCASCHAGDGKGHPFTTLTRFGQTDHTGNQFLNFGGPQLQNRALPGFTPEQVPAGATFSRFTPPAVTGLGFLSYVTDATILALADPNDADGDGISGVPNWISLPGYVHASPDAIVQNGKYIGRFGKKASVYDLLQQTVEAYNQDMGIASAYNPKDVYTGADIDPEVATQTVNNLVFYLQTLKAPVQRNTSDPTVQKGNALFNAIQCAACHKPEMKTGPAPIAALSGKVFFPYTDLLLHDMGSDLNDGYTEGQALTSEWRTPPLWGLGLSIGSQGGQYFLMHDGRATSIEAAILLHGGEAQNSRSQYQQLSAADKQALIAFLKSL